MVSKQEKPTTQPNNEIWYTSSDGNIIKPVRNLFGSKIISNTYENNIGIIRAENDITKIGNPTFNGSSNLVSISIPSKTTTIEANAFRKCQNLTSITIPNSVTSIGNYAFGTCPKLEYVNYIGTINEWLNITIGYSSPIEHSKDLYINGTLLTNLIIQPSEKTAKVSSNFCYCESIVSAVIPNTVTTISNRAFMNNLNLKHIEIGSGIVNIGYELFKNCKNLESIKIITITPPSRIIVSDETIFGDIPITCNIYVPSESVDLYKAADGWKDYTDKIVAIP